ncbi:MAG: DUF3164 family protein [Gluconacetobacter sp.]
MNAIEKTQPRTLTNPDGREIPVGSIRPEIVLQHELAVEIAADFQALAAHNLAVKAAIFEKMRAYQDLMFQEYGVRVGGKFNGLSIHDFGDLIEIKADMRRYQQLTPSIVAAQALINDILDDLTDGASDDLRALVMQAFEKDEKTGKPNVQRILGLRRLNLNHPAWSDAVRALNDSVAPAGSKMAVVCRIRPEAGRAHEQVVVDFSRV